MGSICPKIMINRDDLLPVLEIAFGKEKNTKQKKTNQNPTDVGRNKSKDHSM